jgi:hypothetical protein
LNIKNFTKYLFGLSFVLFLIFYIAGCKPDPINPQQEITIHLEEYSSLENKKVANDVAEYITINGQKIYANNNNEIKITPTETNKTLPLTIQESEGYNNILNKPRTKLHENKHRVTNKLSDSI